MTTWLSGGGARTDAAVRLFCFPHAGGGTSFFRPWRAALAPEIDVRTVVLPGREGRLRERPYVDLERLIDPLFEALEPHADRPFALLGHSLGAIIAFETARRFSVSRVGPPACLFVSGRRAPHLPARRRRLASLPPDELVEALAELNGTAAEMLRQRDVLDVFLPCLRADLQINETYAPLAASRLPCPISAAFGAADPEVDMEEMWAWRRATTGRFRLRVFPGDHFYLRAAPRQLVAAIREDLGRVATPGVPSGWD